LESSPLSVHRRRIERAPIVSPEPARGALHPQAHPGASSAALLLVAEHRQVDERLLGPEPSPHGAAGLKAQRRPQADGRELPHLRRRDLPQEAHGAVGRRQGRVVAGNLDRVQGIALDQLGEELREGVGAEEQLQPDDPAAEGEDGPGLAGSGREGLPVGLDVLLRMPVQVGHGTRLRVEAHAGGLAGDVGPDLRLVRGGPPPFGQTGADRGDLGRPAGGVVDPRRGVEERGRLGPPPLLDTGDGDHDLAPGRGQEGQVQDPVLLGPDQLLAVEQQDGALAPVDQTQLRDPPPLGDLGDLDLPLGQGLVQGQVERRRGRGGEQRKDCQVAEVLGGGEGEALEDGSDGGHVSTPWQGGPLPSIVRPGFRPEADAALPAA